MDISGQNLISVKLKRVKRKMKNLSKKGRSFFFNMIKSSFATVRTKGFLPSHFQKTSITTHSSSLPPPSLRLHYLKKTTTCKTVMKLPCLMDCIFALCSAPFSLKKSISFGLVSQFIFIKRTKLLM